MQLFLAIRAEKSGAAGHYFPGYGRGACKARLSLPGVYLKFQLKVSGPAAFIDKVADGGAAAFNGLPQNITATVNDPGPFF